MADRFTDGTEQDRKRFSKISYGSFPQNIVQWSE
jgi:hypothetical protein